MPAGSESKKELIKENQSPMAIFYDPDQRPISRQKDRFEAMRVFERSRNQRK